MIKSQINSFINQIKYQFSQAKASKPEEILYPLPDDLKKKFKQAFEQLSIPSPYQTFIQKAITEGIINWQNSSQNPNSLVILGNPVESIDQILIESLKNWNPEDYQVIIPINWPIRSTQPQQITEQLKKALEPYQISAKDKQKSSLDCPQKVILIPCLAQCFLRCIGGWEGIELLRNIIDKNNNYFWIIGCNQWTWTFLDSVCQNNAYFDHIESLPCLEGQPLSEWLLSVQPEAITSQLSWSDHQSYWNSLSSVSSGISSIAAYLCLDSLRVQEVDLSSENKEQINQYNAILETEIGESQEKKSVKIRGINPILPELPSLKSQDRYLLYCLVIHGGLTLPQLILSLGEQESLIQSQLQYLLREGIIIKNNDFFQVYPPYYPNLKTELSNNNFLIGKN
jgi:hypothetical protein